MKELRLTVYEILGYIMPGAVALLATILAMWGRGWQTIDIDLLNTFSRREILLLLLLMYFLGHIVQAVGNLIEEGPAWIASLLTPKNPDKKSLTSRTSAILNWLLYAKGPNDYLAVLGSLPPSTKKIVCITLDVAEKDVNAKTFYRLCDAELLQGGAAGTLDEREIYTYREGFYRGGAIGFFLVTVCLLLSIFNRTIKLQVHQHEVKELAYFLHVVILVSAIGSYLFYRRYRRFRQMKIAHSFLGCLSIIALQKAQAKEGEVK